jgi:hypothetical protein
LLDLQLRAPEPARPSQGLSLERGAAITPRVAGALTATAYLIVYLQEER